MGHQRVGGRGHFDGTSRRGPSAQFGWLVGRTAMGAVGWWSLGVLGVVMVVGGLGVVPMLLARGRRMAALRRMESDIATVFEVAARSVRSGSRPLDAIVAAAQAFGGLAESILMELCQNASVAGALTVGTRRRGLDSATIDVTCAVITMVSGTFGGGARALEAGASLLRERCAARAAVTSAAGHARASARLLVAAPLVFAGASLMLIPGSTGWVASNPLGTTSVLVGLAFEACGAWWTSRLVHRTEEAAR